jgi:multidrug resistance protein MdtO
MAPPAHDAAPRDGNIWLQRLAPFPGRFDFALRLALICALTTLVVEIYQTPSPALTIYLTFFLNKPDRMGSIIANVALVVVISIVIALLFPLAMAVIDQPPLRLASMVVVSFVMLFVASASRLKPIGASLALIAAYTLDLLGSVQLGEVATRGLLYAWLFVAIPAGVSLCVNLLVAPAPRAMLEADIARRLRLVARLLGGGDASTRRQLDEALRSGNNDLLKLLKMAKLEKSLTEEDASALSQAARTSFEMLAVADIMEVDRLRFPASLASRLGEKLEEMASCLDRGAHPADIDCPQPEAPGDLSPRVREVFTVLQAAMGSFTREAATAAGSAGLPGGAATESSFFRPDAFTNPDYIRHALKVTAAAMIAYLIFQILDWPGIHTALITCYIVSLGTAAETVEKLGLRIAGCLIGALAGVTAIVFLIPALTSIGGLMILVFLGALPAAWIAVGSPRIAYAGFQIVFAFLLCVVQGSSPDFDLTIARDRVIGILLGNVISYLIFANVWPVSVADRIDHAAARLLRELASMLGQANAAARMALAAQARATLSTLASDLALVGYEPASIRPADDWTAARRRSLTDLDSLFRATLMLGALRAKDVGEVAHELNALGDRLVSDEAPREGEATSFDPPDSDGDGSSFLDAARASLRRVEDDFRHENATTAQVRHAIA